MAKRIKVKGKPPRGLSKAQRIKISSLARKRNEIVNSERKRVDPGDVSESTLDAIDRYDYMIDEISERPDISSGASSTRKKLVKEGNRKFIGPRPLKEFDPYEEIDSPDESVHRLSRGYKKSHRRSDEAEFLRRLPQNQKLSRAEQNMLKRDIASSATSKEGKLLNKLLSALRAQERESFLAKYREIPF